MSRASKAAKLAEPVAAEAAAAELQAKSQAFAEQDSCVSPVGRDANGRFPKGNAGGPGNPVPTSNFPPPLPAQTVPISNGKSESVPETNKQSAVARSGNIGSAPTRSELQVRCMY
jgi:hypothetical protein